MADKVEQSNKHIRLLDSPDEAVRANAALALHRLNHPEAINACLRTLDDDADKLHVDYTPSVYCLIEIGVSALMPLTDKLLSKNEMTRLHAQRAVERITQNMWLEKHQDKKIAEDAWRNWWIKLGYEYDQADGSVREQSVRSLRDWISNPKFQKE